MPDPDRLPSRRLIPITLNISRSSGFIDALRVSDAVFGAGYTDAIVGTGIPSLAVVEADVWGTSEEEARTEAMARITAKLPAEYRITP